MSLDKRDALGRSPLFQMLSPPELDVLAELSRAMEFTPGDILARQGEMGASLFVLVAGEVEVLRQDAEKDKVLAVLGAPESIGEMSLIDREVRSATLRARTPVSALQLTAENFASFRKRCRDGFTLFALNVARVLSARLRETNKKLASRL